MRSSTESSKFFSSRKLFANSSLRKLAAAAFASLLMAGLAIGSPNDSFAATPAPANPKVSPVVGVLNKLAVKGRAPKTGYDRDLFGDGWGSIGSCDTRNFILQRDLTNITWRSGETCIVATGVLKDPYTGKVINFKRGVGTSLAVQIDHVVAVSDAWQKGAQAWNYSTRVKFYNDPLNLLAVDGPTNGQKSDSDAASWLPPNKGIRCHYVARQVAVKAKYKLWVTSAEKTAIANVLKACPNQQLPKG